MLTRNGADPWTETLEGLHTPAWWTGLLLTATEGPNVIYHVKLRMRNGRPGMPFAGHECMWTQTSGTWRPFPWALPATMATSMGLEVVITPVDGVATTAVKIAFQEMSGLLERDHYLFCDDEGTLVQLWDGRHHTWGTPEEGHAPKWRALHVVVPPTKYLLHTRWNDEPFCVHAWNEQVPLRLLDDNR